VFKGVTELVVRTADLLEAEGRALRYHSVRVGMALGLVLVAALLLLGSIVAVLGALHIVLHHTLGPAAAWGIIGAMGLALAGVLGFIAMKIARGVENPAASPRSPGAAGASSNSSAGPGARP
jgi:hypothetical protein